MKLLERNPAFEEIIYLSKLLCHHW